LRRSADHRPTSAPRVSVALALALSALGHALFGWGLHEATTLPDLGIELSLPSEVELGLAEPVEAAPAPPAPPESPPPEPAKPPPARAEGRGADAGARDGGLEDGGVADASAPERRDAGAPDAGAGVAAGPNAPRLPEGTQIAVRIDIARIRASAVADDVRGLLAAIPDFRALLAGSGIDPVTQLDRLLIASPNLSREKVVIAGRYVGGLEVVEGAVARLAEAHGASAPWGTSGGVRTARWASDDPTERLVALVGPQHFVIARPEDLPRVLAIAAARSGKKKRGKPAGGEQPAEALLSMETGEGLSLEVEGVARFVRAGRQGIPSTLRMSATELPAERVLVRAHLTYASADEASTAAAFWERARATYARNPLVVLLGLGAPLGAATIEAEGTAVDAALTLELDQTKLIVGYVRELIAPPAPAQPKAP
jgi:hypothetical protein